GTRSAHAASRTAAAASAASRCHWRWASYPAPGAARPAPACHSRTKPAPGDRSAAVASDRPAGRQILTTWTSFSPVRALLQGNFHKRVTKGYLHASVGCDAQRHRTPADGASGDPSVQNGGAWDSTLTRVEFLD